MLAIDNDGISKMLQSLSDLNSKLAPEEGLEPTTLRLTAACSTVELLRSSGADSTGCALRFLDPLRPLDSQASLMSINSVSPPSNPAISRWTSRTSSPLTGTLGSTWGTRSVHSVPQSQR